ncbi:disease resistance protein RPS4B-like [Macadamia integrifolia]|uniref:disease resistance protein RPS4B-like n=1 Tax=Macadamia integrifolia TaxID=60698 RepID=UPI001C4E51F5|nr:disease resistance protein RPS4B-like [Macadamia integrifolia]
MTDLPTTLTFLGLQDCSTIEMLPSNISDLSGLMILDLNGCKRLQSFPKLPSRLFELRTSGCTSLQGVDVKDLQNLRDLVINYDHFCSKSDEISRLPNLESLILEGCERPQTFPKLPSSLSSLFVEGDTSTLLVISGEIQSMETSQSVQGIHMEGCDHLGNTSRKNSLFQDIHREFEVYGTGSEIPEWISHQNMGSSESFEVSECSGCKIHGLDVSAVFLNEKEAIDFRSFSVICNKTKDIQWEPVEGDWHITRPLPQGEDVLWVRHITICELRHYSGHEAEFGEHFEVGDQVQVSVEIEGDPGGSLQVKKCGVLLVHRPDEEKNLSDDPSVGETISPVDDNVVMDGEESVLVHIEDENKSGHNEGVAGFSIDAKRLKIGL